MMTGSTVRSRWLFTATLLLIVSWMAAAPAVAESSGTNGLPAPATAAAPVAPATAEAPVAPVAAPQPETVEVGLYITQLYDFDMPKRSFNATFWAWFLHTSETYKPLDTIEIVDAKTAAVRFPSVTPEDNIPWGDGKSRVLWSQGKYTATLSQDFDVTKFPFDQQVLNIVIEDAQNDITQTVFVADIKNSKIDKAVYVPGWKIESFDIKSNDSVYDTTYGDPSLQGTSTYSRVTASIKVKRDGLRLLGSMFIGFYVAFALTCLTYFLDTDWLAGSRIGVCGSAIFASVGNKFVVDTSLPPASTFTLADAIEASTFLAILFSILIVVLVRATQPKNPKFATRINICGAIINAGSYITYNGVMIAQAMQ